MMDFNPLVIVQEDKDPILPVVNSLASCHMGEPGVFFVSCGCSSTS